MAEGFVVSCPSLGIVISGTREQWRVEPAEPAEERARWGLASPMRATGEQHESGGERRVAKGRWARIADRWRSLTGRARVEGGRDDGLLLIEGGGMQMEEVGKRGASGASGCDRRSGEAA